MNNFKTSLKNKSNKNSFHLQLIYEPIKNEEITFEFGNSSKTLERKDLVFYDEHLKILDPVGFKIITPKKYIKEKIKLSKKNPFFYDIIGEVESLNNNDIILRLSTVEYIFKKGQKYFVELLYLDKKSNRLEIDFNL